jgi:hypothetical protein
MRYQIGFSINPNAQPFFHLESDIPFSPISMGDIVRLQNGIFEVRSVAHFYPRDPQGVQWDVLIALVAPRSANFANDEFTPWPW